MRAVMREGQSQPRISLREASIDPTTVGVGALAGLAGEITIDHGEVWVTRFVDGKAVTTGPACVAADEATLLSIGALRNPTTTLCEEVVAGTALEDAVARALRAAQRSDTTASLSPSLFMIEGTATSLRAHVIAGTCAHADPTADALRLAIDTPVDVNIIGLYAENREGVLTHHGTRVHMHAIFIRDGARMTAHVDALTLDANAKITVPVSRD